MVMSFSDNEKMIGIGLVAVSAAYFIGKQIYYAVMMNRITNNFAKVANNYSKKEKKGN